MVFDRALSVTVCLTTMAVVGFFLFAVLVADRTWDGQIAEVWAMVFILAVLGMVTYGCSKIGRSPTRLS